MTENATTNPDQLRDEDLIELIVEAGTYTAAAANFGWGRDKLTRYLGRRELKQRTDRALEKARVVDDRNVPALDDEVTTEERLRQQIKEMERQLRAARKDKVYDDRVVEAIARAIPGRQPQYEAPEIPDEAPDTPHEFVLLFSDTHAAEVVEAEQTLGMNEYNWDIMLDRMAKLQRSVLSYQNHRPYPVQKLHIFMLGDMLSGDIHQELAETNDRPIEEATVQFGLDSAAWLEEFTGHFSEVNVVGVPGNHPRRTKKPQAKNTHNNSDWVAYKIAETYHKDNERINFNVPAAPFAVETVADNWRCLLMHGDGIRTTMPGVPWGGVTRRITTLEQQFSKAKMPLDYVMLGHFHTANALDGVGTKTFLNGSVKGLDEYSLKQFGSGRPPSQLLLTFHPRNGVTDVSYIDLGLVGSAGASELVEPSR